MSVLMIRMPETEYNGLINGLRFIADHARDLCVGVDGETAAEVAAGAKRLMKDLRRQAFVNHEDNDFASSDTYCVRVYMIDDNIREIARIAVCIMMTRGDDYDVDYVGELLEHYQLLIAERRRKREDARAAWHELHDEKKSPAQVNNIEIEAGVDDSDDRTCMAFEADIQ